MNYSNIVLFALGILGILGHSFVELNKLNKANGGNASIKDYLKMERFAILVSLIVIVIGLLAKQEITALENCGNYLGLGFVALGYMGQSILVAAMGKASKQIGGSDEK